MLRAGAGAAKRAVEDLLLTDEERAARDQERAAERKKKNSRLLAYVALGLLLVVGLIGLALTYWHWFLLAGVLGIAGIVAARYVRKSWERRRAGVKGEAEPAVGKRAVADAPASPIVPRKVERRVAPAAEALDAKAVEQTRARDAAAVDEELAALKAKFGK